mmetsp:Transcript_22498/g.56868  ORF Transcript_22498/g.56868 Transcript_22498/m.56868 type:complete len:335 (-) Transcript_22498:256-1260(-)
MSASEAQSSSRPQTAEWVPLGLRCGLDLVYKDDAVATLFANLSGPSVSSSSSSSSSSAKFVEESEFFRECCGIDAKAMHRDELEKGSLLAPINDCAREAMRDFHSGNLAFTHGSGFAPPSANFAASLLAFLLKLTTRGRSRQSDFQGDLPLQQEVFVAFRDALLVAYREEVLTKRECEMLTTFASSTLFAHFKLYQYVLAYARERMVTRAADVHLEFFRGAHLPVPRPAGESWVRVGGPSAGNATAATTSEGGLQQPPAEVGDTAGDGAVEVETAQGGAVEDEQNKMPPVEPGTVPLPNAAHERAIQRERSEIQRRADKMLAFIEEEKEKAALN